MRKPIILLVLFVILMVATLAWSVGRDRPGSSSTGNTDSGNSILRADGKLNGNWRPPSILQSLSGASYRWVKGAPISEPTVHLTGQDNQGHAREEVRTLPQKSKQFSAAKLRLTGGSAIAVRIGDDTLCLCARQARPGDLPSSCPSRTVERLAHGGCTASDTKATLPLDKDGPRQIVLSAQASAEAIFER
jgi:hypothetical protein